MNWSYRVKKEWMVARQCYLTATDIKDLVPVTKTGRPRKISEEDYFKVLSRKHKIITEDDLVSTGWAARGHIMEPVAIDEFNRLTPGTDLLFHWDDKLINNGWLSYSPDALNIPCAANDNVDIATFAVDPVILGEVKCYGPEKHNTLGHTHPSELEERWQIATAMVVSSTIEKAYLILFNPSYPDSMFVHEYTRDDLSDEIEVIKKIHDPWQEFLNNWNSGGFYDATYSYTIGDISITEDRIYEMWNTRRELNPQWSSLS